MGPWNVCKPGTRVCIVAGQRSPALRPQSTVFCPLVLPTLISHQSANRTSITAYIYDGGFGRGYGYAVSPLFFVVRRLAYGWDCSREDGREESAHRPPDAEVGPRGRRNSSGVDGSGDDELLGCG